MFIQRLGKYFIRRMARAHGFLDPMNLISTLSQFSQPAEVAAPTELLRAGAIFHARGLINSQAIQHNLDWIWPYWVEKQFDPNDVSFVPRAFSATHINLTHRNWTAVGRPNIEETPIVDPRGLVTPLWDGWSIDFWIINKDGEDMIPSRLEIIEQFLDINGQHKVITKATQDGSMLTSEVELAVESGIPFCCIHLEAEANEDSSLVVSLRPCNPEGISLVKQISILEDKPGWKVNNKQEVIFDSAPQHYAFSNYHSGDVYNSLFEQNTEGSIKCPVDMASAGATYLLGAEKKIMLNIRIPLRKQRYEDDRIHTSKSEKAWDEISSKYCQMSIPESHFQHLFDSAIHTLLIHTAKDVFAGPYTYKRFWFRDAVYITYALICCGFTKRAENILDQFHERQKMSGYFESQEGEWDSNGQVLWLIQQFCQMTNTKPKDEWKDMIYKGTRWILKKRIPDNSNEPHSGLMPAGFSAEHFGPNDYYYWDDFWSIAGLQAASELADHYKDRELSDLFQGEGRALQSCVEKSLQSVAHRIGRLAMPSSPYRRLDSASVGSLVEGYPLQINLQKETRLLDTAKYLMENCLVNGGFFHDMSHSGINPYLTLHIAQVLLRSGDPKFFYLMQSIADLASPTGQWPEAIHPATKGGCMGDGQHVWAASEWILMMRNCFVREEKKETKLVLLSGIPESWYQKEQSMQFGPAPTSFGTISIHLEFKNGSHYVSWQGDWQDQEPIIELKTPDSVPVKKQNIFVHTEMKEVNAKS